MASQATAPKTKLRPGTMLSPVPAVLVSCGAEGYKPNVISIAWVGTMCSEPPTIAIGIRPSRYSHPIISEGGDFVVNLPTADQAAWIDYCGSRSGRDTDKFVALELEAVSASVVQSPMIAQCPVNIECKVAQVVKLGSHDVFFGEVVAAHAIAAAVTPAGGIDPAKANLVSYAAGAYWTMGERIRRRA